MGVGDVPEHRKQSRRDSRRDGNPSIKDRAMPALNPVPNAAPPVMLPLPMQLGQLREKLQPAGRCMFREIAVPLPCEEAMKKIWKSSREAFFERGYSIRHHDGQWILSQWLLWPKVGGYSLTPRGQEILDNLRRPTELGLQFSNPLPENLPPLPNEIEKLLRGYQVQPSRQLYRALSNGVSEWGYPGAADLSDMGVGKTYMDLAAALSTGRKPVVLCPTVGTAGWGRAFQHFNAEPHFIGTYEAVRGAYRPGIATKDAQGKFTWLHPQDIVLVLDEAQYLRHDDTLTVQCCSAAIRQGIPIIVASATIATSPLEMRFAGRVTGLHGGADDWHKFLAAHGCERRSSSSGWKWDGKVHHLQRIHGRLFPSRGCRVRKEDLGDECPETVIKVLPFDIVEAREIEKEWDRMQELMDRLAQQGANGAKLKSMERQARMRIWQKCEEVLVPYVSSKAWDDIKDGRSVAMFMNFNASRLAMAKAMKTTAGFFGGQPLAKRQYWEKEFQANRQFCLVNNIGAGGASVSLHDTTGDRPRTAYIFPTDHVVQMEQATGRVDRVGGKTTSYQYIPCVKGAMTEQMVQRTRIKMMRIATLNDGHQAKKGRF